jgi:uridylate kinase
MRIVLRIGGSVVASPINAELIGKYANLLVKIKEQGHDLVAIVGGGGLAREFIQTAKGIGLQEKEQDEIAISTSRLFAQLLLKKLGEKGCIEVPVSIDEISRFLNAGKIVVMGGLRPGMTTDTVAALVAEKMKANLIVKGTDQEGVYDKDPRKFPDAVKLDHIPLTELSEIFSESKHKAGIHQIIDPEAVKILSNLKVKLIIVNGFKPENVLAAVNGNHVGTIIE